MRVFRTLRGRLVIAAAAAVLLAVAGVGVGASQFVTDQLRSMLDTSLRQRAGDVARLSASAPSLLLTPGTLDTASGGRALDVEVLDRHERIVSRSLSLGARVLPITSTVSRALHAGASGYENVTIAGQPSRLFAAPLAETGGPAAGGAVVVASHVGDIDTIGRHLRVGLLGVGALAALIGAAVAALLVTRALRPLRRLSHGVSAIERTGEAAQRVEEPATTDEVHELAAALNRMLRSLEATTERERRLLADASHELRTPLTSLAGNVDFLAAHGPTPELVADLQRDTARLRRLVDDLLALEREAATDRPTVMVDLSAIALAATGGHERVDVEIPAGVTVPGDAAAILRAITNLVENALTHGPADGRVHVTVRSQGGHVEIAVRDDGPGIPEAAREIAFERFWRGVDAAGHPGSGLGLAIVRATALRHGGTVRTEQATVILTLPLADAQTDPREPAGAGRA
jgi:signal transduction histidine kinase